MWGNYCRYNARGREYTSPTDAIDSHYVHVQAEILDEMTSVKETSPELAE